MSKLYHMLEVVTTKKVEQSRGFGNVPRPMHLML